MSKDKKSKKTSLKRTERGLGRGLSALMQDISPVETKPSETAPKSKAVKPLKPAVSENSEVNILEANIKVTPSDLETKSLKKDVSILAMDQLQRNPDQPRRYFDPAKLRELTESIQDKGVLQPILVRPLPRKINHSKTHYQIVAGERRYQAALKAGLVSMPVLIRDLSDQAVLEIGVVENVQRADLNPIEEALAYRALVDQFERTQEDIAKAIGKSRPHIANMLRLLTLPKRAQEFLQQGKITTGHARAIIAAPDPVALAEIIVEKNLSVRAAEDWVRRLKTETQALPKVQQQKSADTRLVETELMNILGLKVDLRHKNPNGELRISYKSADQLEDIIRRLKG